MAKAAKTAWGIDVGNCTLTALKLGIGAEGAEVLDFAVLEHEKILSQPELAAEERSKLITSALSKFLEEHDLADSAVVVSVPGQSSFARFIKLPPVESKEIPKIVRYEAIQQIPFDIEEVEWDWQTFQAAGSPEAEVGIFAIKRTLVREALGPFTQVGCPVGMVQMAPMALYNFLRYDQKRLRSATGNEAVIAIDIGAESTNLVIAEGPHIWQRSIPIGGNQFTAAVQKAFKLSFTKAEAIKRTANTSKYARQIFQAMRSVFADLAAEVQRSLGFYSSSNRDVQFREVLALGSAMKLPGLLKFLQQSLSLPVKRLSSFESLKLAPEVSMAQFTASLPNLALAYGLALQGIGLGTINSNLLPREIARQAQWKRKQRSFAAAAGIVLLAGILYSFQGYSQRSDIKSDSTQRYLQEIVQVDKSVKDRSRQKAGYGSAVTEAEETIAKHAKVYEPRDILPQVWQAIRECLPGKHNVKDDQQVDIHEAFVNADRALLMAVPRSLRQQVFISDMQILYTEYLENSFDALVEKSSGPGRSTSRSTGGGGTEMGMMGDMEMEMEMMGGGMGMGGRGMGGMGMGGVGPRPGERAGAQDSGQEKVCGFVVVIEGTTPHKDNLAFLSPPNIGLQRDKWGFFTRLRYLGKTDADIEAEAKKQEESEKTTPGSPPAGPGAPKPKLGAQLPGVAFGSAAQATPAKEPEETDLSPEEKEARGLPIETYIGAKNDMDFYFDISEGDWVSSNPSSNKDQPAVPGIIKEQQAPSAAQPSMTEGLMQPSTMLSSRQDSWAVYVDPLTLEPISSTYVRDEQGKVILDSAGNPQMKDHDYWFRIKFKLKLKKQPESAGGPQMEKRRTPMGAGGP